MYCAPCVLAMSHCTGARVRQACGYARKAACFKLGGEKATGTCCSPPHIHARTCYSTYMYLGCRQPNTEKISDSRHGPVLPSRFAASTEMMITVANQTLLVNSLTLLYWSRPPPASALPLPNYRKSPAALRAGHHSATN